MGRDSKRKIGSGEVGRFDQRNHMFSRPRDHERATPEILEMGKRHYGVRNFKNDAGYTLRDWAPERCAKSAGSAPNPAPGRPSVMASPPQKGPPFPITTGCINGTSILKSVLIIGVRTEGAAETASGYASSTSRTQTFIALSGGR